MMTTRGYPPDLADLADRFLQDYFAFYPATASMLGLHNYDGYITDMSAESVAARVDTLRSYQQHLQQIAPAGLDRLAVFDYALLRWQIEAELWAWTEAREHLRNPMMYSYQAMVDDYLKRNYAPLPVRARALIRHLEQLPAAMQVARENLARSVPRVLVEEALNVFAGLVAFIQQNLPHALGSLDDPVLEQDIEAARDKAVQALNAFQDYLRAELLPAAHDDFAVGARYFADMLRYNELVDLPLDRLLAIGERDMARNQQAIAAIAQQLDPTTSVHEQVQALGRDHPAAEHLLEETRALLDNLRNFLRERDLVTLPPDDHCRVEETPPFARWAFAMMDTAGPFEQQATDAFYYVTLPEADWSPEQVEGWLTKFDYATLTDVSIHEAYPGHFVHFSNIRNAPTRLARVVACYSHYESWAHYAEQMMLEQGYGGDDPHLRMAQLAEALVRNCRYICAIKMHTQGMSIEAATRFFMKHAYMDEVTASKEARRGTHDPGYINYTLGKLMLLKLLEQYRAEQGENFSLKRFHDEYIGYGSPPVPLLRTLLLQNDDGAVL